MANVKFKYTEGKGTTPPPQSADSNALYLTDGRIYKGNVPIADLTPAWVNVIGNTGVPNDILIANGSGETPMWVSPDIIKVGRAAIADDLGDIEERVDSEYLMQPTAKDESIRDGYAQIESLKGNSLVWNQWATYNETIGFSKVSTVRAYAAVIYNNVNTSHKYIAKFRLNASNNGSPISTSVQICIGVSTGSFNQPITNSCPTNTDTYVFFTPSSESYKYFMFAVRAQDPVDGDDWKMVDIEIHDLTQMFQEGNEPTTLEEFNARKPKVADEYAYNEGEIISFNGDAIKSVGFNQWDEEWELGWISSVNGLLSPSQTSIRSKNYIRVIPKLKYFFCCKYLLGSNVRTRFYDESKNYIGYTQQDGGAVYWNYEFTIPNNAHYLKFEIQTEYGTTYNHDICINLSNPAKNGEYEPYRQFTRNLPRRGELRSAGTAYDEIYYNHDIRKYVKVQRMGEVDLGTLAWSKSGSINGSNRFAANLDIKIAQRESELLNGLCSKYTATTPVNTYQENIGICHSIHRSEVLVYDPAYTNVATFKAAMKGVKLIYELAEPIETVLSDVEYMDYYVENGGTEQVLSENNTTPIRTTTAYNFDAVTTIRQNRFDVSELKSGYSSLSSKVNTSETNISQLSSYVVQNATAIDNIATSYLPLSGGTLTGTLTVNNVSINNNDITIRNSNGGTDLYTFVYGKDYALGFGIGSGDVNRGIYDLTNGHWWIYKGAKDETYIPKGNVGIGTTSPAYKLDVAGTGRFTGNLTVPTINGGTPITSSNIASQSVSKATYATFIGDSNEQLGYQSLNDALDQISTLENAVDALPETYSPIEGSASLTKYSGGNFGNAAAKNYTTSVQSGNANLVTSGAVYSHVSAALTNVALMGDLPSIGIYTAESISTDGVLRCEPLVSIGEGGSWSGNDDIQDGNIVMIINYKNINGDFTSWMDIDHNFEVECGTQCTIYSGSGITFAAKDYKLYPTNYL